MPQAMTRTALKAYFEEKRAEIKPFTKEEQRRYDQPLRYAPASLARMKVALSGFSRWLMEQGVLSIDPTKGITLPRMATRPPRILSPSQRFALQQAVERACAPTVKAGKIVPGSADLRGAAIFALGYYAGFRVSDVSHLMTRNVHLGPKVGWCLVGYKQEKFREIDLLNAARKPLYDYLQEGKRAESHYVFTSQRSKKQIPEGDEDGWRLTEDGVHQWFQDVRAVATVDEAELVDDIPTGCATRLQS
ncbi:MAG: tyrosine-type recombinase/integrase [Ktedonobacteraceae bacterium]|nr:tyrosine-type recombinase/integrase [Ktedonobacteraceae bacterium]